MATLHRRIHRSATSVLQCHLLLPHLRLRCGSSKSVAVSCCPRSRGPQDSPWKQKGLSRVGRARYYRATARPAIGPLPPESQLAALRAFLQRLKQTVRILRMGDSYQHRTVASQGFEGDDVVLLTHRLNLEKALFVGQPHETFDPQYVARQVAGQSSKPLRLRGLSATKARLR